MASEGVGAMRFLPSALNVKVMKFKQARVNGGSNYDSLKGSQMPRHLVSDAFGQPWNAYALSGLAGCTCSHVKLAVSS